MDLGYEGLKPIVAEIHEIVIITKRKVVIEVFE